MSELIPRHTIQANARQAAEQGKGPDACPYATGTDAEFAWKDAFYLRLAQLPTCRMMPVASATQLDPAQVEG